VADLDIAAFLRARLDEREAKAQAAILRPDSYRPEGEPPGRWDAYIEGGDDGWAFEGYGHVGGIVGDQEVAVHIADNDPAFVLADVKAKRQILDEHAKALTRPPLSISVCNECGDFREGVAVYWPCKTLRLLALPHAGHPDYDESWKP
jgi:hypothetical protein